MSTDDFDFRSVSEEPDNLDYEKMKPCPSCKKPIPQEATMCYYCGKEAFASAKPRWVVWTAVIVIVAFAFFLLAAV